MSGNQQTCVMKIKDIIQQHKGLSFYTLTARTFVNSLNPDQA